MTMKKRVPPRAHNKPKVTAMCIHNLRLSGLDLASHPDTANGAPRKLGKYDVTESEAESTETAIPHTTKKSP